MPDWGGLASAVLVTARRMAGAYGWAIPAGLLLGLLLGGACLSRCRSGRKAPVGAVRAVLMAIRAVPVIGWFPLMVRWPGPGEPVLVLQAGAGAALAIGLVTDRAIREIPTVFLQAAATMGARGWRLHAHVVLPAALPRVLGGLRAGWAIAWGAMLAAEMLLQQGGLGHLLIGEMAAADPGPVLGGLTAAMGMGLLVEQGLLAGVARTVRRRWGAGK